MIDWLSSFINTLRESQNTVSTKDCLKKYAFGWGRAALAAGALGVGAVLDYRHNKRRKEEESRRQAERERWRYGWHPGRSEAGITTPANREQVYRNRVQAQLPKNPATQLQIDQMQKDLNVSPGLQHYAKDFPIFRDNNENTGGLSSSKSPVGSEVNGSFNFNPRFPVSNSVSYSVPGDGRPVPYGVGNMTIFHEGIHGGAYQTMLSGQRIAHGGSKHDLSTPNYNTIQGIVAAETPSTAATFLHMYEHPEFYHLRPSQMTKNVSNRSYYPIMYPHPGTRWDVSDFGENGLGNGYTVHDALNREAPLPVVYGLNGKTRPLTESMLEGSPVTPAHRKDLSAYLEAIPEDYAWDDDIPVMVPSTPMGWIVDRRGNFVEPTRDSQISTMGTLTGADSIDELPDNFRRIIRNVGHGATQGYKDMMEDPGTYYATQEDLQAAMSPLYAQSKPGVYYGGDPRTEPTVQEIVNGLLDSDPNVRSSYAPWINILQPRLQYKLLSVHNNEEAEEARRELAPLLMSSDWSVMDVPELSDEQINGSYTPGVDMEPDMRSIQQMRESLQRIREGYRRRNIRAIHGDMFGPNVGWS